MLETKNNIDIIKDSREMKKLHRTFIRIVNYHVRRESHGGERRERDAQEGGKYCVRDRLRSVAGILHRVSCVVCSREFIVLYLDRRYFAAAAASRRGDRRLSTRGDGEGKKIVVRFSWLGKSSPPPSPSRRELSRAALRELGFARRRVRRRRLATSKWRRQLR